VKSTVPTLHITNGDSAAGTLRTFLPDPVVITADPLFDGPASAGDDDAWYAQRARQLTTGGDSVRHVGAQLAAWDRAVDDAVRRGDEIVLWFEHDLFDQLLLIRMIDRIGRVVARKETAAVSLICIDRFPGIDRFIGLGQLSAAQLATLVDRKAPVTAAQFDHASVAWAAFRADDPTALAGLTGSGPLPFLGAALQRFLQEYPSTRNGLSRSAQQVLQVLDDGSMDGDRLFIATQQLEESPFIGDWGLFDVVRLLGSGAVPLVTIIPPSDGVDLRGHAVAITDAGREVRAGRRDCVALNGIDQWRGGVHLLGERTVRWRWDDARQTLISLKA